ncbi:MAG: antitoxin [Nanoarchaeota archaeon]
MVQAVINIDEHTNRILNIVKAKFGLKDKSQAIDIVVSEYEQTALEPELRPEYKTRLAKIINGRHLSREDLER